MKIPSDLSRPNQLVLAGAGLIGLMLVFAALTPGEPQMTPEQQKEAKRLAFCRSVIDVVKPDDPTCGKDLPRIRAEIAAEKEKAKQAATAQAEAAQEASNPGREISTNQLTMCWMSLKQGMRDPSSFRINSKTRANGGLIDYTATNGFGGPSRAIYHCTTGRNVQMD